MVIKNIIILCLINYISIANSSDNEDVYIQVPTDSPDNSLYSLEDVITRSNDLELVKIKDCDKLLQSPDESYPGNVSDTLIEMKWPTRLVDDIVVQYSQSSWPTGITCEHLSEAEKETRIKKFKCRRVPGFVSGNREEAVIVLAVENIYMTADSIGHPGFLMFFKPGALNYINLRYYRYELETLEKVEITRWDLLLTPAEGFLSECVENLLLEKKWPRQLVDSIVGKYDQNSWPSGISGTKTQNKETMDFINRYTFRHIPGDLSDNQEQAVVVFASDNAHMPADMIAEPGFLTIFGPGALPLSSCFSCPIL